MDSISIFFPTYNEEANIKETILKALEVLKKKFKNFEIIVVNDGSRDKTREIIEKLGKEDTRIRIINHKENKGYGASLKSGFKYLLARTYSLFSNCKYTSRGLNTIFSFSARMQIST